MTHKLANEENYYVRIWNKKGSRVFGWLGISDSYAACVPAGVYSNPKSLSGILPIQWRANEHPGQGILASPCADGDYGLGGKNDDGVDAYWHWLKSAYPLRLNPIANIKLDSPVRGTFSGTLTQTRDHKPFALHTYYTKNNDVFGLQFHDVPTTPNQLFSGSEVYLEFTSEELLFEFVPTSSFAAIPTYAPATNSKYNNWSKYDTWCWMGDLSNVIGERSLADLVIPGSHDAASWSITNAYGKQRSQTQSREIYGQLRAGSRYLDLRFYLYGGVWTGYHGKDTTTATLEAVLDDINRFLNENPKEIIVISLLPYEQSSADNCWDIVLTKLGERVFPRVFFEKDGNGVEKEYFHLVQNINQKGLLAQNKNIVLFSWGKPPKEKVLLDGVMKDQRKDYYLWSATPEGTEPTPGERPWEGAFTAAKTEGYKVDFDLQGVWLNSFSTTANDIRLVLDVVEPPTGGPLWMMHINAPASPGLLTEDINTKADRIQPPFARLVREDPTMTAKLNFVNLDFVGDHLDMTKALIEANLFR